MEINNQKQHYILNSSLYLQVNKQQFSESLTTDLCLGDLTENMDAGPFLQDSLGGHL